MPVRQPQVNKLFNQSARADKFSSSKSINFEDEMFTELSAANKLLVMLCEEMAIDIQISEFNETLYVSRDTITELGEALGLL